MLYSRGGAGEQRESGREGGSERERGRGRGGERSEEGKKGGREGGERGREPHTPSSPPRISYWLSITLTWGMGEGSYIVSSVRLEGL